MAGGNVEWVHGDAASYAPREPVGAARWLCGSAFTMPDLDVDPVEHDGAILWGIAASLKPAAQLVLTTPNGYRRIREVTDEQVTAGTFDPASMVQVREDEFAIGGAEGRMRYKERIYILPELIALLAEHGMAVEHGGG